MSSRPLRVVIVAFDGVQTLDMTGPAEVFAAVGRRLGRPRYEVVFATVGGLVITTSSGMRVETVDLSRIRPATVDTVVVAGGEDAPLRAAAADPRLLRWLSRAKVRRLTSVCSGAFLLATAGLLDGRRATTHWSALDALAQARDGAIEVDRTAIWVRDGAVWTSAGVTTGIDMALAMVEEDVGRKVADLIAAHLVLYARRPGYQSQFSDVLVAQSDASDPLAAGIAWARAHLRTATLESLARRTGLSLRTFHRRCLEDLGTTPAKLLEKLRVEEARTLLSTTEASLKEVAATTGFGDPARMKRAFDRALGLGPRDVRLLFRS